MMRMMMMMMMMTVEATLTSIKTTTKKTLYYLRMVVCGILDGRTIVIEIPTSTGNGAEKSYRTNVASSSATNACGVPRGSTHL
jgi:hypothetical protein